MMRALFKDQDDNTLFAAEIARIVYLPDYQKLYCITACNDDIYVPLSYTEAESCIRELYEHGKVNLSIHPAYLNPEDDDSDESLEDDV